MINALQGHLAEFGVIIAKGPANLKVITDVLDDKAAEIPSLAKDIVRLYLDQIALLTQKIDDLTRRLREAVEVNEEMRRLCTVPGVGPVTAGAILAFAADSDEAGQRSDLMSAT